MGKKTNINEKISKVEESKTEVIIGPGGIAKIIKIRKVKEYK